MGCDAPRSRPTGTGPKIFGRSHIMPVALNGLKRIFQQELVQ